MTVSASVSGTIHDRVRGTDRTVSFAAHVHEASVGFRRCGVSFNPAEDPRVDRVKILAALLMDELESQRTAAEGPDAGRCLATSMTHLEAAAMFAVKAAFQ